MKTFEKKIKKINRTRMGVAIISLLIAMVLFIWAVIEVIPKEIEYGEFNRDYKGTQYAKTTIHYLTGPIIQATDGKTGEVFKYYVATGENEEVFIIRTGKETDLPVYGQDVTDENKGKLEGIEIYGVPELTSGSLMDALNIGLNRIFQEEIANSDNFTQVMGAYYLDTVGEAKNIAGHLLIIGLLFLAIGLAYVYINKKTRKKVEKTLKKLESNRKINEVLKDYESGRLIEYRKVKVSLSPKYVFDYNNGLEIIEVDSIKEVSISKKDFTNRKQKKCIILETKDGEKIAIAPFEKRAEKVVANELLAKLRTMIV